MRFGSNAFRWFKKLLHWGDKPLGDLGRRDSEATCEVVRVTEIIPHGNADKLEIAHFELAGSGPSSYDCVVQKGSCRVGELAAYFGVDCIVPMVGPFKFLANRLDGANKTHFRLRAARLRGVYSQGLLLDLHSLGDGPIRFGEQLWERFAVEYHRPPEPGEPSLPISNKPSKPQPLPVYSVESLKKVPRLFDDVEQVYITEKIHGTNFRFGWVRRKLLGLPVGWKFVVGSHRCIKDSAAGPGFYKEDLWTEAAKRMDLARRTQGYWGYKFFGELYGHTYTGQRIQDMVYGRKPEDGPGLALFDIQGPDGWLDPSSRNGLCGLLGLPMVPSFGIQQHTPACTPEALAEGKSLLCPDQIREGVVVESVGVIPRKKAKYVSQSYLLRNDG